MRQVKNILRPVSKEFRKDRCCFDHPTPDDFVKSQWQSRTKSTVYLIYRWLIAIFFTGVVIESMIDHQLDGYYFIYLTNWGILMCMATNWLGAGLVTTWHFHPEYANKLVGATSITSPFKIYWAMHITTLVLSVVITIVYWSILHTADTPLSPTNVLTHAFNAIFMFLDLLIVAYPIRLLHVFLPVAFGIIFVLFSIIYNAFDGVDIKGNHYIYNVLDWNAPEKALITVIGVLLLTCFVYMIIFSVYKLRVFIYRRLNDSSLILPTTGSAAGKSNNSSTSSVVTHTPAGISMALGNYTGYDNQGFSRSVTEKL